MTRFIKSIIKGTLSLIKAALAIFLVLIALVSLLSASFSGQLTAPREETPISDNTHLIQQIADLQQQLDQAKQGHPISCRIDALFLGGLFSLSCDVDPILISSAQMESLTSGQILSTGQVDGLLGQWGIIELRLVVT